MYRSIIETDLNLVFLDHIDTKANGLHLPCNVGLLPLRIYSVGLHKVRHIY